jgi:hypothetical protein
MARLLRKFASLALTVTFAGFGWAFAHSITPGFQIYAKSGRRINNPSAENLIDSDNSVIVGYEPRSGLRIGFDSKHGFGIVFDF